MSLPSWNISTSGIAQYEAVSQYQDGSRLRFPIGCRFDVVRPDGISVTEVGCVLPLGNNLTSPPPEIALYRVESEEDGDCILVDGTRVAITLDNCRLVIIESISALYVRLAAPVLLEMGKYCALMMPANQRYLIQAPGTQPTYEVMPSSDADIRFSDTRLMGVKGTTATVTLDDRVTITSYGVGVEMAAFGPVFTYNKYYLATASETSPVVFTLTMCM